MYAYAASSQSSGSLAPTVAGQRFDPEPVAHGRAERMRPVPHVEHNKTTSTRHDQRIEKGSSGPSGP